VTANHKALEQAFQATLADTDVQRMLAPGGLLGLLRWLREAGNEALQTGRVREVLLTDFVIGESAD
jgi:flagellar basal body-associated protein FliL